MSVSKSKNCQSGFPHTLQCSRLTRRAVKLIFSFLISYPLAAVLKRVPDTRPDLKNGFIITYVYLVLSWLRPLSA